jgi:hypothetical protein
MRLVVMAVCLGSSVAQADATFRIAPLEQWQHQGYGSGPVRVVVGDTRLHAKPGQWASVSVPANEGDLVGASVSIGARALDPSPTPAFYLDVEDHHSYTVENDPCCFCTIGDDNARFIRQTRCELSEDRCPQGMVGVNPFVFRKDGCGKRGTCAPPPRLRVEGGPAEISFDGSDPEAFGAAYRRVPAGRESSIDLTIRRRGSPPMSLRVLFRHANRYTLILGATPRIVRDP